MQHQQDLSSVRGNLYQDQQHLSIVRGTLCRCPNCDIEWEYFDEPKPIGTFGYKTKEKVVIPFDNIIPYNCQIKKIKLILFLRTGGQENTTFWTRLGIRNQGKEFVHWTYGHRYPQSAISYNSETIEVPCSQSRELFVNSNHIQPTNCHNMQYFISAVGK